MSDEQQLFAEQERGRRASALLSDPLLSEAFDCVRRAYVEAFEASGHRQDDERKEIWRLLQTVRKVREHIETVAQTGRLADLQLQEKRRRCWGFF